MSASTLTARSLASVWHPCTPMKRHEHEPLLAVARAQGPWLYDPEGQRYLDAISSWWVNLFGHSHPYMQAALVDQLSQLDHVMLAGCTHRPVVELSEKLAALTGLGHASYGSDGASAIEIALKMSAHYWRNVGRPEKHRFVGLSGGYHGETVGALSVTDVPIFRHAYEPLIRLSDTVPSPDARKRLAGESSEDTANRAAHALRIWLEQHHAQTAAIVIEPLVQCAAGMAMYDAAYLKAARAWCDQYDVHMIVDEIATGFGRTGSMFAYQQAAIRPDFIALSKGLTGGTLPLSVVLTTDTVYEAFYSTQAARAFLHSHSYTGNPLACRAALATLELFEMNDTIQANRELANQLNTAFAPLNHHSRVQHARQQGMIWAWDIQTTHQDFPQRYHAAARARGLLLRPIGNTLYCMPPYVLNAAEGQYLASQMLAALEDCLEQEA
jgi:adenosylmethionine-8-amino-7-oxononanoate aminotransferase